MSSIGTTNPYPAQTDQTANSIFVPVQWLSVTKSDSTTYDPPLRGVWVGTGGDLAVVDSQGTTVTIPSVPAGTLVPGYFQKVMSSNTTAAGLCGVR